MAPPPSLFALIWHIRFVTLCTSCRKSSDKSLLCFVFPFSDGSTPWRRVCVRVELEAKYVYYDLFWSCVCVCSGAAFSSLLRQAARPLPPPEIEWKGCDLRTKSRAKCFLSLLFSPLSVLAVSLSFFPAPSLSFFLLYCGTEVQKNTKQRQRRDLSAFYFYSFSLIALNYIPTKTLILHHCINSISFFPLTIKKGNKSCTATSTGSRHVL